MMPNVTVVVLEFERGLLAPHDITAVSNRAFANKVVTDVWQSTILSL